MTDIVVVGSYVQDLAFNTPKFPAPGESRIGTFTAGEGGKGFNQAVAANRQGVKTLFIGAVGNDLFGKSVLDFINNEKNLTAELEIHKEHATGAASIIINETAQNLIVVALGANDFLTEDHLNQFQDKITESKVLISQVESNLETTAKAFKIAKQNSVTTILNPAPINENITSDLVQLSDILTPNETEFSFLMKHLYDKKLPENYWELSDKEIHHYCNEAKVPTIVLTLGDKGCFVSHNPDFSNNSRLKNDEFFYRVSATKVIPTDTTGAGDAFNGGLASGMIHFPDNFRKAIEYANAVAGLSVTRSGTAPAMPSQEEVTKLFL